MKNCNALTQLQKFCIINKLKRKIKQLSFKVAHQNEIIQSLKYSTKSSRINQQQLEIQKLNDQNKRLVLILEDRNKKQNLGTSMNYKDIYLPFKKKDSRFSLDINKQNIEVETQKQKYKQKSMNQKFLKKYEQILVQNEKLKKQVLKLKFNQHQKKKNLIKDRNGVLIQRNNCEIDKIKQKNKDLQVQLKYDKEKNRNLNQKILQLQRILQIAQNKQINDI